MPSLESLKAITILVYDAAADPDLWLDALERLRGELNAAGRR